MGSASSASGSQQRGSARFQSGTNSNSGAKGTASGRAAPPPSEPPVKPPPRVLKSDDPHFSSYAAYEEAWGRFEVKAKDGQAVRYADIPWPLCFPTVSGASSAETAA